MVKTPRLNEAELVCPDGSLSEFRVYGRGKNGWLNKFVLGTYLLKDTYSFRDGKIGAEPLKGGVFREPGVLERALYAILIPYNDPVRRDVRRKKEDWLSDIGRDRERNILGLFLYAWANKMSPEFIVNAFVDAGFPVETVRPYVDKHSFRALLNNA